MKCLGADIHFYDCRLETPLHAAIALAEKSKGTSEWEYENKSDFNSCKQEEQCLTFPNDVFATDSKTTIQSFVSGISTNQNFQSGNSTNQNFDPFFTANQNYGSVFSANQNGDSMIDIISLLLETQHPDYINGLNDKGMDVYRPFSRLFRLFEKHFPKH